MTRAVPLPLEGEARERLIRWIRRRMKECGITFDALEQALVDDARELGAIRYRDAYGNTWTGAGDMPSWLRRAVAAGQSIEHFRTRSHQCFDCLSYRQTR
ncbi:H-NS family nucleoid-associated regulatory protein [Paraburkholderia sp. SARCC-3016]|uniref:H-NS family nucleoid-associated regulatory protein n=1 Tax=Paraburkholderia sp. SARCC-3016 TaxID=3058611 RepID=UPI002808D67C|nr:H-NS family nucleoid-associated regulatory protein [Paraburkholderia sp. SARCC-3016]MDQ7981751.1 H-NS family nucleoid-associated regulatory protein [Paraburkholderia sp. SARCC-3016]